MACHTVKPRHAQPRGFEWEGACVCCVPLSCTTTTRGGAWNRSGCGRGALAKFGIESPTRAGGRDLIKI